MSSPAGAMRGLTLIELMVSMVIGLLLMVAITSTYLGTSEASRAAEAQSRMNEDAQAALSILTQQLRMAGNNPKQPNRTSAVPRNPVYTTTFSATAYQIRGCDGKFGNLSTATDTSVLTCAGTTSTLPDSIGVTYEADRYNTVPTTTSQPTDCLGQSLTTLTASVTVVSGLSTVTTVTSYWVADNRFYVGTSSAIISPSLYCKGNGGGGNQPAQPLVENVEDIQFSYGTSPAGTGTGTVAGYLDAAAVEADTAVATGDTVSLAGLATSEARWRRVVTIRICVLVRSEGLVAPDLASARYTSCDGTVNTNPPDLRLRRAYFANVVLRNRLD